MEPPPLEAFSIDDVEFEIRDETSWQVGSGQHSSLEHHISRGKLIYDKINETPFKNPQTNGLNKGGIESLKRIFKTPTTFAHQLTLLGILSYQVIDDVNVRMIWYPKYKHEVLISDKSIYANTLGTFATQNTP